MRYWITTHWPHRTDTDKNEVHEDVHVPDGREKSVSGMCKGDLVFIYETKTGRSEIEKTIDGGKKIINRRIGMEGIVVLAEIYTKPYEVEDSEPIKYDDGSKIWWRYCANTKTINSHGFVPREKVNQILGYDKDYSLRGFGIKHSGVKEISSKEYQELLNYFKKDNENENKKLKEKRNISLHAPDITIPEGEMHKKIKELIASNPSIYLNESNLRFIKKEHIFETGDRVDILLQDQFGRFVVVEVEPECGKNNHIGSEQCMKYRSLMSFEHNRKENEVRAILASQKISKDVAEKAERYKIETKEIKL